MMRPERRSSRAKKRASVWSVSRGRMYVLAGATAALTVSVLLQAFRGATEESAAERPVATSGFQRKSLLQEYVYDFRSSAEVGRRNRKHFQFDFSGDGIDRRSALGVREWRDVYDAKWPVLVTDVVPTWPAFNWTKQRLLQLYANERVSMKAVDGALEDAVSLALPLRLFIANSDKSGPRSWTYVEDELFIPRRRHLYEQLGRNVYQDENFFRLFPEDVRPWDAMLLWGTAFSRSQLHLDPYNWTGTNAVISGTKRWKLFPPGQDHLLYVRGGRSGFPLDCTKYNSYVDSYSVDVAKFPKFPEAKFLEFEQKAGELLFIPTGWFHQAFNVEETLAVSSQLMNRNNYRAVLEEIFRVDEDLRAKVPRSIDLLVPEEQVKLVMKLLSADVLERGRNVTKYILQQVNPSGKLFTEDDM